MPPQQRAQLLQKEGRLSLAFRSFQEDPSQSKCALATSFDVPESTLRSRIRGTLAEHEIRSSKRKLQLSEEQALVQWILDLDRRGFSPQLINVRRMADLLLNARGQIPSPQPVGKNWVDRFINTQPELKTKWDRKFHSQRARCEDKPVISTWFKCVEETRKLYGIIDEDTYNFDETGFMMGVAGTSKVVTSTDTIGRAVVVQLGNREWVTVIEGIGASGRIIPPFIIFAGKVHLSNWY